MLTEVWHYLGVRTAGHGARQLGYAHEAAALQVRHRRCREAWRPHLDATRDTLLAAARRLDGKQRTALIVGGGVIHDLPVAGLLEIFERVVLLDIAFTRPTRRLAESRRGRIELCYWDTTGVVESIAQTRQIPKRSPLASLQWPTLTAKPDWIASVNCWLQLPLLPAAWLQRHGADERELEAFARELIDAHWHWLTVWQTPICMISEVGDRRHAADGSLLDETDYRPLLQRYSQQARHTASWTWRLHPSGELPGGAWEDNFVEAWETDR